MRPKNTTWSPPTTLVSLMHSNVASAPNNSGQPPSPGACTTLWNLSGLRLAKCSERANCQAPRTLTAKWLDCSNDGSEDAVDLRLHSTSGGSSETAEKELAVSPSSLPAAVRVVMTVTPVTKRPNAFLRWRSSIAPSSKATGGFSGKGCRIDTGFGRRHTSTYHKSDGVSSRNNITCR